MLKTCLFIIFVMFMKPALSASFMSHEKFAHLDYEEQRQIVIATMELVVEMESKYKHEVKTTGFNSERFRKYSEFMSQVSSLFFPEAHAAGARNQRYGQYLNQLTTILNQKNRCIYGGWVSEMRGGKCTHPLNTQFKNLYQSENGCNGGNNKITCNPAIFGFKNVDPAKRTLFCVDAGPNGADNTSRDCMAKALAESPESGASSKEARIANMIEGIGRNPVDATAVFNFLIKACACDSRHSPQINADYSNYMRPHQTCYSILKMMADVTPSCQVSGQPLMNTNQTQFLNSIRGIITDTEMRSSDVRTLYSNKLNELRTSNAEFRATETAVCGGAPAIPVIVGGLGSTGACVENKRPNGEFCCPDGQTPNAARTSCSDDTETNGDGIGDDEGEEIVVIGTRPKVPEVITDDKPEVIQDPVPDTSTGGSADKTPTACVPLDPAKEFIGGECRPKCAAPTPRRNPQTFVCEAEAVTPTDCTPPEPNKEFIGGQCRPLCNADTEERNQTTFACECKHGDRPEGADAQCPAASEEESEEAASGISINLSTTNKDTNTTTVSLTVTPASTVLSEYTIIWFSRGKNRPSTFPGSTATKTPPVVLREDPVDTTTSGDATSETETSSETNTTWRNPGDDESAINRDNVRSIDAPRQSNEYELCARLIKNSDRSTEDDKCVKVPLKPAVVPRGNGGGNPFGQPQMGPTRGGPSDAIFRGIR